LLGFVPDGELPALYNAADLFVLASRRHDLLVEGFGIACVEAAACGLAVIGSRSGGIPEAIREGDTGVLVHPEDPAALAAAADPDASEVDVALPAVVDRLPIGARRTKTLPAVLFWARRAAALARQHRVRFVHCGNVKPAGYPARWVYERQHIPYGIFFYGADL